MLSADLVIEKSGKSSTDETIDIAGLNDVGWKWKACLAHTNGVSSPVLVLFAAVLKSYSTTNFALHQATEARESQVAG